MASRIAELASLVNTTVSSLDTYLTTNDLPTPSFAASAPLQVDIKSPEINQAKSQAIDACIELLDLLQGPVSCMIPQYNATALQVIIRRGIAQQVPLEGSISFEDLAEATGLDVVYLQRIVRFAITFHHLFEEPVRGQVAHSNGSRLLATDDMARAAVWQQADQFYRGYARNADALDKFDGMEPNQTGFALAHETTDTMYNYLIAHPKEEADFSKAMAFYARGLSAFSESHLVDNYEWSSLPSSGTVVDIGGSDGYVSKALSTAHPSLNFIVQDLESVIAPHQSQPPDARVTYQAYNFTTPQSTRADAYLFRGIFHNWPDHYVLKILRNQIPALTPGARVILNENLNAEPGTLPLTLQRRIQYLDMIMLTVANARLRTPEEWGRLFAEADPRFGKFRHWKPPGSIYGILEVVWEG